MKRLENGVYRNLKKPVEGEIFISIEVPDSIYKLEIVAVSKNWEKIEDHELADGPDWFTTDVHDDYIWEGWYYTRKSIFEEIKPPPFKEELIQKVFEPRRVMRMGGPDWLEVV